MRLPVCASFPQPARPSHSPQLCAFLLRYAPKPSVLYKRVRAVFELFGPLKDVATGKPLFNDAAWAKASNVLKEIKEGHASDPPGYSMYKQRIDANGEPATDGKGSQLLDCIRGSNFPENVHKNLHATTFHSWNIGAELTACLLREFRHRYAAQFCGAIRRYSIV